MSKVIVYSIILQVYSFFILFFLLYLFQMSLCWQFWRVWQICGWFFMGWLFLAQILLFSGLWLLIMGQQSQLKNSYFNIQNSWKMRTHQQPKPHSFRQPSANIQPIHSTFATHKSTHSTSNLRTTKPLIIVPKQNNDRSLSQRKRDEHIIMKEQIQRQKSNKKAARTFNNAPRSGKGVELRKNHSQVEQEYGKTGYDTGHGILISVNIQDLVQNRNPSQIQNMEGKKQNSVLSKQQKIPTFETKRVSQKSHSKQIQGLQFECTQQLVYTKRSSPPPRQRTISKHKPQPRNRSSPSCPSPKPTISAKQPSQSAQVDLQQQISIFCNKINEINNAFELQSLMYLDNRQQMYRINPKYIQQCQPNFNWKMRACVVEWMMEVAEEFSLKRETFHIAVNLVDRFLEKEHGLARSMFQAVGATCMFIASKVQEFQPKTSEDFSITTGKLITAAKLKEMQRKICQVLCYNLNPPTLFRWANRLMLQWDTYTLQNQTAKMHPFFATNPQKHFKQASQQAYINYRLLLQLIDCSALDIETAQYSPKILVLSFMYLFLTKQYKIYNAKQIALTFPQSSIYLFDENNLFNQIFNEFLEFSFGYVLQDLLPTIQYAATFFVLPPSVDVPAPAKKNSKLYENMDLEEYECFQTFDKNMMKVVVKRRRGVF